MRRYAACVLALLANAPAQSPAAPLQPDLRVRIEGLTADLRDLERRYDAPMSAERRLRLRTRLQREQTELWRLDFATLATEARVDWHLLDSHVARRLAQLEQEEQRDQEVAELLPFAPTITALHEARRQLRTGEPEREAAQVAELADRAEAMRIAVLQGRYRTTLPSVIGRAGLRLSALRQSLQQWFAFRDGYDPEFGWWLRAPHQAADQALGKLGEALQAAGGPGDQSLIGDPIGEAALRTELGFEWVPYAPAELVAIAERELVWCEQEQAAAATAMGCSDWRQALERVKQRHRPPGQQPELIRELAHEAIAFLEQRELVTIPELAKECWRMGMMSPQAQRTNPFFLGGETIYVSFPTDAMAHIEKLQALRSNNEHFCRATVHHELIPGHWLQQYSQARHRTWREPFDTPFWVEGWALYWEMRLYGLGFAKGPEDRIGMLYWRKHRCARIVFSLNFHLGRWTGPQCVEYLIQKVGHERAAAEGEVRRSLGGLYPPLYQAAYMLGGLQLRALHTELVGTGKWGEKAFHDAVLQQNSIPITLLRQALLGEAVPRQLAPWRFDGK